MNITDYGRCLEEYEYDFETDCELTNISYSRYNEKNTPEISIGVEKTKNRCFRNLIEWPNSKNKEVDGLLKDEVSDMKLYLDTANRKFNFDDIIIFRYDSAKKKTEDEYEIIMKLGKKNISIYEDKRNISVYDKVLNMLKVYGYTENGNPDYSQHIEDIRITDFGVITEEESGNLYMMHLNNKVDIYKFIKLDSPIECLEYQVSSIIIGDEDTYEVAYDEFGIVSSVHNNGNLVSRYESYDNDGFLSIFSLYPTMITQNYDNFQYDYGTLWNLDSMYFDEFNNPVTFIRHIYYIDSSKKEDFIKEFRSSLTKPIL